MEDVDRNHISYIYTVLEGGEMKRTNVSDEVFAELKQALEDAVTFECGEGTDLQVTRILVLQPTTAQAAPQMPRVVRRKASPKPSRPRGPQM